jgi:transposase
MLALMKRARFGRSSERIDQLELLIGDLEEAAAEQQAHATTTGAAEDRRSSKTGERRPRGRQPLPAHLPRERVVHAPACACPACGGTVLTRLGEDEREVLDYVPSHFKVMVHVRPKMSCRQCETIIQAPVPSLPIERGRPGPNLLAHVLVAKYCDHVPLHRQSVIYGRAGVELERSTLADWVGQAAFLLEPLAAAITRHVRGVRRCMPTTPRCRCWIQAAAGPRLADCGFSSATSALGVDPRHRRSPTSTPRIARANMRGRYSTVVAASCMPTVMPASTACTSPMPRPARRD